MSETRAIYECPKVHCDWTLDSADVGGSGPKHMAFVEGALRQHIDTHPIHRRIMARRVRKLRRKLGPTE